MTLFPAAFAPAAAGVYVGAVWVLSPHLLVSQALAAALSRRVADVRALAADEGALAEVDMDPSHDVLLILDDLGSHSAVASVRSFAAAARARVLVLTTSEPGPFWGALLEGEGARIEIAAEPETTDRLAAVIEQVCAGVPVLDEVRRRQLVESWNRHLEAEQELVDRMALLSPRELTVLDCLASGRRSVEIAPALGLKETTVRTHIRNIRRKLAVDSQLRAVLALHRYRSITPSTPPAMPSQRGPQD